LRVSGNEAAFIECNTSFAVPTLLAALAAEGKSPRDVRWIVVTHVHLDHAGGAGVLAAACPQATVLAHPAAARHLRDPSKLIASAREVYGAEKFAALYGEILPVPADRVRELADGESVDFGNGGFRVHHTRGHAKHHFVVEDDTADTVFTGDTFGLAYPVLQRAGTFAFPSTSPAGFEADEARKSLDVVLGLNRRVACLTHYGPYEDLHGIAEQMRPWIDLSERLLDVARAKGPESEPEIREALRVHMAEAAEARGLSLTASDWDVLKLDLDLNAQGLVAVASR
jgi:glyoxylase-like metal-dependent hydrolase (beta-lactamase superfamily II)